jgi:hypothetical protein
MFDINKRREEITKQIEDELNVFIDLLPTSLTQLGISTRINFWYNEELVEAKVNDRTGKEGSGERSIR